MGCLDVFNCSGYQFRGLAEGSSAMDVSLVGVLSGGPDSFVGTCHECRRLWGLEHIGKGNFATGYTDIFGFVRLYRIVFVGGDSVCVQGVPTRLGDGFNGRAANSVPCILVPLFL